MMQHYVCAVAMQWHRDKCDHHCSQQSPQAVNLHLARQTMTCAHAHAGQEGGRDEGTNNQDMGHSEVVRAAGNNRAICRQLQEAASKMSRLVGALGGDQASAIFSYMRC